MFKSLLPKENAFFNLFDEMCTAIVEGIQVFLKMIEARENYGEYAQKMKAIEHQTDQIAHSLMARLHRTFITPIDREAIHQLAGRLDDILDQAEAASSAIAQYCPECIPNEVYEISSVLLESVKLVQEMVKLLHNLKRRSRILELTVEINRLENQADYIRRTTIARLFREEKNPFELIKLKDVLEYLERATDCCEDVANITEGIVLENT